MIRIGNQTSSWAPSPSEPFDYAVTNGFDAFEWFPDKKPGTGWDDSDLAPQQRQKIRETAIEKGIRLSVHARWQANPLHPESAELFSKDLDLARDLGAALFNIHLYHELGIKRFVNAIGALIQQTSEMGLQLSIENTPENSPEEFNELFLRLRKLDSLSTGHVGMCLDLGHANLSGATRNDYLAFVDRLDPGVSIIHLHLHENWGDVDTHLTLFTGPAGRNDSGIRGFAERMRKRNYSGSIIFEQWPQPPSLLNQARDRLLRIIKDEEDLRTNRTTSNTNGFSAVETARPTEVREAGRGVSAVPQEAGGLEPHSFLEALVKGDKSSRSWREKLDMVRELIVERDSQPDQGELAYVAIYLRFLSAGQIAGEEDGRHFRPGHHARISQEIQERLASVTTSENSYIIRKIYAALPSSAQEFQRAEPLTRIRDIAHRNDIPSDIKKEIKTTLQNKLHRCAGPEDLETSKKLLERITAPGANYSAPFVEQFRIFHEELKEFFNARGLDERLSALAKNANDEQADLIRLFLGQKSKTGFENQIGTLRTLIALRRLLASTVRNKSGNGAQEFILSDIGLEGYAFVLLSQLLNEFESSEPRRSAVNLLEPLGLIVSNLALSGISTAECEAIDSELNAWGQNFDSGDREQLLRIKATIERARRVAESFSEAVISSMLVRAEELGRALGVAENAIRVFCEAEIRSHLVFQLSKAVSILLRRLREALELPGWDILVSGNASGRVKTLERLDGIGQTGSEPVIAVLKKAEGDEEIPKSIKGILLAHEIPHLSHLAVRARQARVVFVGAEDRSNLDALEKLNNQMIRLTVAPDKVEWSKTDDGEMAGQTDCDRPAKSHMIEVVSLRDGDTLIVSVEHVTGETGGQKAVGLRKLGEISKDSFVVPSALVIPFGVMEKAFAANSELQTEYWKLIEEIDQKLEQELEQKTRRLREMIEGIKVPEEIIATIRRDFHADVRLMVRSSANCEDLDDFSGAGLYESIANIQPTEAASAIRRVWSSLWTRRAVLSRNQAGIPHRQAQMAVIVQEMIRPDYSFILHTVNPLNQNADEVYAEIALGLGETLASGAVRGTPYRLACDKKSKNVQTLSFANFSEALRANSQSGVNRELVDYSREPLSGESEPRRNMGRRLAAIGSRVETEFGKAQDIEGAITGNKIYLVQSQPQQGL